MTATAKPRFQDLPDVGTIADGEVVVRDGNLFVGGTVLTGDELGDAIATINAALAGKQDASTAATDAELAAAVATINSALAAKQDASTAATDAELALHIADTTFVHGIANTTLVALTTDSRFPSAGQKAGLVGTDGTPGSGNKYVTNSDARNTNSRAPTAHVHPTSDVTGLDAALTAKQDASTAATDAELTSGLATKEDFGKVAGKTVPTPGASQNGQVFHYDHGTGAYVWAAGASQQDIDDTVATHEADTTDVHGIADTSLLVDDSDARLSDSRTPTDGSVTAAKVNAALKPSGSAAAGTEALRALGTSSSTAAAGNDSRLSDARAPTAHTHPESDVTNLTTDLAGKQATSEKGQASGYASLDSGGKVPTGQIPALALVNVSVVGSQAAQLALTAQAGDVAIRSDESKSYVHNGGTAGTMADWTLLQSPASAVLSVNGQTGVVSLTYTDVGAAPASHTHTASQVTDFDTQVRTNRLDQMAVPTSALSVNSQRVTNLAAPSSANDAARKVYVDDGLALKQDAATAATDAELAAGLATKADASHTHPESEVTGLVSDLAGKQPLDSDLTAIAALSTTSFGRGLLALADQAALLSAAGAQAADSDLTAIAALSTTSYGRGLLTLADQAALLAATGAQASDSDLSAIAALTTTSFGRGLLTLADQAGLLSAAGAAAASHSHAQSDVTGLVAALAAKMDDGEAAGGVLSGTYPNPGFAADMATQAELNTHEADTTSVHGIADTSVLATATSVATAVSNHEADTTAVHGIANTANLILEGDARLSDARTPSGTAGGVLSGSFPNPGFAVDMATQAELDAVASGVARFASLDKLAVA